ncbi:MULTISPECIES: M4 family metallopeptidase [Halomonadaceae]|uniref:Neutral metalloproteinase n=1 Tax=Modicisalibacter zincidurans TaxID=1178777 RepID=A0ABP9RMC6_9GAMM|nr:MULTISPECIES: M4 family metallopeptidase [Halomonas]MCD6009758.1 peptidase M4 family protein [Halomonas sp. IOP_31]
MTRSDGTILHPGFTPPYILERLREHGSPRQRRCAEATLTRDRGFRAARGPQRAARKPEASAPGRPARYIHSAEHRETLPGRLVREEDQPGGDDPAVEEAYRWLGATYRFFWEVFERHSIDANGMPLIGTVHFGQDYANAFWNGAQMVFGDGDDELFRRFTIAVDVVAHELAHGVTERESGLVYAGQSGALNESLSDVFGSLVKQFHRGERAAQADWLIGAELLTEAVQGRALRSMAEPGSAFDDPVLGRDPQPAHMDQFVVTQTDNGGVHINSGIPNRAFYLAAQALDGYAWEVAGQVWYATLRDSRLSPDIDFAGFAALTVDNADRSYGRQSREQQAIRDAWQAVGVRV